MTGASKARAAVKPHPSYPNPTIAEALCEIHFRRSEPWQASLVGEFFKQVQGDFPGIEPGLELAWEVAVGRRSFGQRLLPPRQRTRFRHKDRPLLLQLSDDTFTVNALAPYPGWDILRSDVLNYWKRAVAALQPQSITRIGLRYLNRIPREAPDESAGSWLRPGDYLPSGALNGIPGSSSRVEAQLDAQNRLIVSLADIAAEDGEAKNEVLFDLDRIVEKQLAVEPASLETEIERLHGHIWDVFESAKTDRLERLLQRMKP
jgi:uncharacterized protein (TIGR04255 family)